VEIILYIRGTAPSQYLAHLTKFFSALKKQEFPSKFSLKKLEKPNFTVKNKKPRRRQFLHIENNVFKYVSNLLLAFCLKAPFLI